MHNRFLLLVTCILAGSFSLRALADGDPAALQTACDANDSEACFNLGLLYVDGQDGVTKDLARAVSLYQKACDARFGKACHNLGDLYAGRGRAIDFANTSSIYKSVCKVHLGIFCNRGRSVDEYVALVASFYQKACDAGEILDCTTLAAFYMVGEGVEKDPTKAVPLYQKACDANDADACDQLGFLYHSGEGVEQDLARALSLFQNACNLGDTDGCDNAKILREQNPTLTPSPTP